MGRREVWGIFGLLISGVLVFPGAAAAQRPRFRIGQPIEIGAGDPGPQAIALGDLNKDGRLDIAVVSPDESAGPVAVLLNQGGGEFAAPTYLNDEDEVLGEPVALAIADVGAEAGGPDGNNDLIIIDADGGFVVAFGDGTGQALLPSELVEINALGFPRGVVVADFDGKKGPDLGIIDEESSSDNGEVFFLCNAGQAAVFDPCSTLALSSGGEDPIDIGSGDFNGDGRVDVAVLNRGDTDGQGNVALFLGNGDGGFTIPTRATTSVANEPRDLTVANFNPTTDAIDDVAVGEFEVLSEDNVTILLGATGNLAFARRERALLEVGTTAIAAGRFTNDDFPDLAGGNDPNQSGSSILTLAIGEGEGEFQDPLIGSLMPGGARALAVGRLDGDDLDDLVALNLAATQLRIGINTFDAATPTITTTSSPVPTRTASPTVTAEVTATGVSTGDEDDACSIAGASHGGGSWLPFVFGAAIWLRLRINRHRR